MQQILISITTEGEPSAHAVRALAMLAGENLQHYGHTVRMVTAAQSPIAVDPRVLGLKQVMDNLSGHEVADLQARYPQVWLALSMLNGTNEESHNVPIPAPPA